MRPADDPAAIRLVVNADDVGAAPEDAPAVVAAHRDGIVTSASVLGNAAALAEIAATLRSAPALGIGVQLTLTEGAPTASPDSVRSLLTPDGRLPDAPGAVFAAWAQGRLRQDDIAREFDAQLARVRAAGLEPRHLSTRHHVGFLPAVARALADVARRHGIAGVRLAMETPSLSWIANTSRGLGAAALAGLAWLTRDARAASASATPQTWGYAECGRLDVVRVLELLGRMGPGPHELICHPQLGGGEATALRAPLVRDAIARRRIVLCRWPDLF